MAAPIRTGRALLLQRLVGLVFLAGLAGAVLMTVAVYQKRFTPVELVTLQAGRVGNQLTAGADVKLRGVLVGSVREVRSTGDGAEIVLALEADSLGAVPADVRARLLPKTLFGEKFVALQATSGATGRPLRDGDVITADRSETALETERVLDDLMPLLQALRPQQLATTLNALSGALRGRGDALGANLVATDAYFARLNPELPALQENLRRFAALAETYDQAAPDLLALLDELSAVNRNLVDQQQELTGFLSATTGSTQELDRFVRSNERRLVRLAADSLPTLQVYSRYAPQYPCLLAGLVEAETAVEDSFGVRQPGLHITLETGRDLGTYVEGDEPAYRDDGGPTCRGLPPNAREIPFPFYRNGQDGYRDDQAVNPRTGEHTPRPGVSARSSSAAVLDPARALAGDPAVQRDLSRAVVGSVLGVPLEEVSDLADLLFGPLARGTTVRVS